MKLFPLLCLFALAAAAPLTVQAAAPIDPAKYPAPVKVACVGDSITFGSGAGPGQSYPDQLQKLLGRKWEVKNFGVGGRTLLNKGDFPYQKEQAFQDTQAFQPDVVIVMLGTNDTKPQNWVHHDEFYQDYHQLVAAFAALPSHPRIFVCRPPPAPAPAPGVHGINETNLDIEIPLIDRLAKEDNLGEIDMHAALEKTPELLPDHVHPNTAGAAVMARTACKVLTGHAPPAM